MCVYIMLNNSLPLCILMYPYVIIYCVVILAFFFFCLSLPNPTWENWLSICHIYIYIYIHTHTQIYTIFTCTLWSAMIRQRCSWMLDTGHSLLHSFACILDQTFIAQAGRTGYLYWVSESRQRQPSAEVLDSPYYVNDFLKYQKQMFKEEDKVVSDS